MQVKLKSSHWIVDESNRIIFGKGRMDILENIEKTGSINQTAKLMKMSYKGVWSKIKSTEKHLGFTVVHTDRSSGSKLSTEGKAFLEKYQQLNEKCMKADDMIFSRLFGSTKKS